MTSNIPIQLSISQYKEVRLTQKSTHFRCEESLVTVLSEVDIYVFSDSTDRIDINVIAYLFCEANILLIKYFKII